jgi:hypothetical protein
MSAVLGMLMLTGTMAAAEPNVTLYQLQKNCPRDCRYEDRVAYRAHYKMSPGGCHG